MKSSDRFVESLPASSVVFVIESDSLPRRSLDTLPDHARWRMETVPSVRALLELRRPPVPCCLVLSIPHPDSGLPLEPWRSDIPVICLMEAGDVSLSVRAMRAGAFDVLTKPAEGALLLEAVVWP